MIQWSINKNHLFPGNTGLWNFSMLCLIRLLLHFGYYLSSIHVFFLFSSSSSFIHSFTIRHNSHDSPAEQTPSGLHVWCWEAPERRRLLINSFDQQWSTTIYDVFELISSMWFDLSFHHENEEIAGFSIINALHYQQQQSCVGGFGPIEISGQYFQTIYRQRDPNGRHPKHEHIIESNATYNNDTIRAKLWSQWQPHFNLSRSHLLEKSPHHIGMIRLLQHWFRAENTYFVIMARHPLGEFFHVLIEIDWNINKITAAGTLGFKWHDKKHRADIWQCGANGIRDWLFVMDRAVADLQYIHRARIVLLESLALGDTQGLFSCCWLLDLWQFCCSLFRCTTEISWPTIPCSDSNWLLGTGHAQITQESCSETVGFTQPARVSGKRQARAKIQSRCSALLAKRLECILCYR